MNAKQLLTTGLLLSLMASSTVYARSGHNNGVGHGSGSLITKCDVIASRVIKLDRKLNRTIREIQKTKDLHYNVERRVDRRVSDLRSSQRRVDGARQELTTLRYEGRHAPRLIKENREVIKTLTAQLPAEQKEAQRLKAKYKAISKWRVFKRGKAKRKYKDQVRKIDKMNARISSSRSEIKRLQDVQENFNVLEGNAERRVFRAEDLLNAELSIVPTIDNLRDREQRVKDELYSLRHEKRSLENRLEVVREKLVTCRANSN